MPPDELFGISCLADGADEIFAKRCWTPGPPPRRRARAAKYRDGLPATAHNTYDTPSSSAPATCSNWPSPSPPRRRTWPPVGTCFTSPTSCSPPGTGSRPGHGVTPLAWSTRHANSAPCGHLAGRRPPADMVLPGVERPRTCSSRPVISSASSTRTTSAGSQRCARAVGITRRRPCAETASAAAESTPAPPPVPAGDPVTTAGPTETGLVVFAALIGYHHLRWRRTRPSRRCRVAGCVSPMPEPGRCSARPADDRGSRSGYARRIGLPTRRHREPGRPRGRAVQLSQCDGVGHLCPHPGGSSRGGLGQHAAGSESLAGVIGRVVLVELRAATPSARMPRDLDRSCRRPYPIQGLASARWAAAAATRWVAPACSQRS